jgi:hypothetical protein
MKGTLHEDEFTFFIISRSFLLRMRNISDKVCRQGQNTHFRFINVFRKSRRLWHNVENYCRVWQDTRQYGACALHAGFLRLQIDTLIALPLKQWLHGRASILRYTDIACLVNVLSNSAYTSMLAAFVAICKGWDISARVREREMSSYVFAV